MKIIHTLSKISILVSALAFVQTSFAQTTLAQIESGQAPMALAPTSPAANSLAVSVEQTLLDEGYIKRGDGLYATQDLQAALFATTHQGRQSLAMEVGKDRDAYLMRAQKNGIQPGEKNLLDGFDGVIADLSKTELAGKARDNQVRECITPNGATLRALAISNNGTTANAFAANVLDFSPATATTNRATSSTDSGGTVTVTTVGSNRAISSQNDPLSCNAFASASVTCPGETAAAVFAYAPSTSSAPACL
jgi:hypothetical protein